MDLLLQAAQAWPASSSHIGETSVKSTKKTKLVACKSMTEDETEGVGFPPRKRRIDDRTDAGLFLLSSSAPSGGGGIFLSGAQEIDNTSVTSSSSSSNFPNKSRRRASSTETISAFPQHHHQKQDIDVRNVITPNLSKDVFDDSKQQCGSMQKSIEDPEPLIRRSSLIDGVPQPLSLEPPSEPLQYEQLINFPRSRGKAQHRRCVMCGHFASGQEATCSIPLQNKDVCKRCDTGIWRHLESLEYFKWCKGCKKFLHVSAFAEKLQKCSSKFSKQPSKCDRCRERGRQSYMSKRHSSSSTESTITTINDTTPCSTTTTTTMTKTIALATIEKESSSIQRDSSPLNKSTSLRYDNTTTVSTQAPRSTKSSRRLSDTPHHPCALLVAAASSLHHPITK